ncbi:MAG: TPM domain-containing protein [Cycloclasticus sp.]|jgi:uncharacterized protein|nr:TPM domain-containing protein [Cycloclasticus sp.]
MQRIVQGLLIFGLMSSLAIAITFPINAVEVQNVPNPRQSGAWVTDMSNMLSPETETQLNQMISKLEQKNGTEIAVVTVPNTAPYGSPKEFTTELFNYWGVGKKGTDNGVVFMISQGDRRVEIETGYGVEDILPDAKVGNIINQKVTPRFKQGNFDQGVLDGTKALVFELSLADFPLQKFATRNFGILLWLSGFGAAGAGLYKFFTRPRYLDPQGKSTGTWGKNRAVNCKTCKQLMSQVDDSILSSKLSEAMQFSRQNKFTEISGWACPSCSDIANKKFHILTYLLRGDCSQCPDCKAWTVLQKEKIVKEANYVRSGKKLITKTCEFCDYHHEETRIIPKRTRSSSSSYHSGGGGGFGGGSSGSSGGGGGFGGGSSGGGGAGGDW